MLSPEKNHTAEHKNYYLPFVLLLTLAFLGYLCYAESIASYSIKNRTWGFDNMMYYGKGIQLSVLFVLILLIVPAINQFILQLILRAIKRMYTFVSASKKLLLFALIALLSFVFFYQMQVKYHLLGDFDLREGEILSGKFIFTEYLSMVVPHYLAKIFLSKGIKADDFFRVYSCVGGPLYVFVACLLADEYGKVAIEKLLAFFAIVCSSLLLFFCGYVEVYSVPAVLLLFYMYTGIKYLHGKSSFYLPVIVVFTTSAFHLLNAAAIPSLVVLFYWRNKNAFPFITKRSNHQIALFVSVIILLGLIVVFATDSIFLMPLKKHPKYIAFLSFKHIWEFVNGQILCTGLNVFVCLILFIKITVEKIRLIATHYFLLSISGALLILILICNLQRGSGDWDIMAFPAIPLNLLCILLCLHVLKRSGQYLALFLCGFNLLNAFLWIEINHSEKSIEKVDNMFQNDPAAYYSNRISGKIQLALWFKNKGLFAIAKKLAIESCNEPNTKDYRGCLVQAECARRMGEPDEAVIVYEWLLSEKKQPIYEAYLFLLDHFARKKGSEEKVLLYLRQLYDSYLNNTAAYRKSATFSSQTMSGLLFALYEMEKSYSSPQRLQEIVQTAQTLRLENK